MKQLITATMLVLASTMVMADMNQEQAYELGTCVALAGYFDKVLESRVRSEYINRTAIQAANDAHALPQSEASYKLIRIVERYGFGAGLINGMVLEASKTSKAYTPKDLRIVFNAKCSQFN